MMICRLGNMEYFAIRGYNFGALLMTFVPTSSADDNIQSASTITPNIKPLRKCATLTMLPVDEVDWWKVTFKGDVITISFQGKPLNNQDWLCFWATAGKTCFDSSA